MHYLFCSSPELTSTFCSLRKSVYRKQVRQSSFLYVTLTFDKCVSCLGVTTSLVSTVLLSRYVALLTCKKTKIPKLNVRKRNFIVPILNELSHKESRLCVGVLLIVDTAKHLAKHFEQLNYCYTYEFYAKTILRCE